MKRIAAVIIAIGTTLVLGAGIASAANPPMTHDTPAYMTHD